MQKGLLPLIICLLPIFLTAQDLTKGLIVNDLSPRLMQEIAKPTYLNTITDPSFGTTIRRITDAGAGGVIVPMYSTVQAWNSDESLMILYNQSRSRHMLLDGMTYQFIRMLDDVRPTDLEEIFWDFEEPNIFYYVDRQSDDFIRYSVNTQAKQTLVNLAALSNCSGEIIMGNDIQMMSWDSDVFTFRCGNEGAFAFRISTSELTTFNLNEVNNVAPGVAPSGDRFQHRAKVYDNMGNPVLDLNKGPVEHSCIGKLANGNDGYFAIAFAQGPQGGCIGDIIAHDLTTGECFPVISESQGYDYPQSGTHISSLAYKNTEGGWIAASMIGYDRDGQSLLDQELVIAKADKGNIKVCRIGHHRSDEEEFDYWGEPHAVISPTGTRVLFGSDWSGSEDGQSVDSYVVELPAFLSSVATNERNPKQNNYQVIPNPVNEFAEIRFENPESKLLNFSVYNSNGRELIHDQLDSNHYRFNAEKLPAGIYFFKIFDYEGFSSNGRFVKE